MPKEDINFEGHYLFHKDNNLYEIAIAPKEDSDFVEVNIAINETNRRIEILSHNPKVETYFHLEPNKDLQMDLMISTTIKTNINNYNYCFLLSHEYTSYFLEKKVTKINYYLYNTTLDEYKLKLEHIPEIILGN